MPMNPDARIRLPEYYLEQVRAAFPKETADDLCNALENLAPTSAASRFSTLGGKGFETFEQFRISRVYADAYTQFYFSPRDEKKHGGTFVPDMTAAEEKAAAETEKFRAEQQRQIAAYAENPDRIVRVAPELVA